MKFIGLDAHSRNCFFVIVDRHGNAVRKERVMTHERELLRFLRSVSGRKKLIFEESSLSQWLYLLLKDEVEELVVCQPEKHRGPKTDWIDATKLANLLRTKSYIEVFHSDDVFMTLRTLSSGYNDLVDELVAMKNRYNALFRQAAIVRSKRGELYRSEELISLLPTETMRFVAGPLLQRIWLLEEQKKEYEAQFEVNVRKHKELRLLTTIPGIGAIRANQIAAIVVTPYRFPSKYKFYAYAMLVRHHKISDGRIYGKQKAFGPSLLKDIFMSSTNSVLRGQNSFRRFYDSERAAGLDNGKARKGVARKIAATSLGVWKSGVPYDDNYREVTPRPNKSCHSETESL